MHSQAQAIFASWWSAIRVEDVVVYKRRDQAVELAKYIDSADGVSFGGLMTYPPKGRIEMVRDWMGEATHAFQRAGLACETISSGGTPDIWRAHEVTSATEHRAGTYIYNDRSLVEGGVCSWG